MSVPNVRAAARPEPDFDALAASFEERRVAALQASAKRTPLALSGVALAAVVCLVVAFRTGLWWVVGGVVPAAIAAWSWRSGPRRAYLRSVKDEAFPAAVRLIGPSWRFERTGGIDLDALKAFGILPTHNIAKQQDLITGQQAGTGVRIAEAKLTHRQGTGSKRRDVTVFKGVIVLFDLANSPGARIVIRRRFRTASLFSGLERVRLETSGFEREFNVYADDQVAARILLTVTVMERLLALSDDLRRLGGGAQAERLEASVVGDQLLVLVPCNANLFEARGEDEAGHVEKDVRRLLAEVRDVLRLAEALGVSR